MVPYHNPKITRHRDIGGFLEKLVSAVGLQLLIEVGLKRYGRYFSRKRMHHMQTLPVRKHNSSLWHFKELVERENEAGHRAGPEWSFLLCSGLWTWTFKKWRVIGRLAKGVTRLEKWFLVQCSEWVRRDWEERPRDPWLLLWCRKRS